MTNLRIRELAWQALFGGDEEELGPRLESLWPEVGRAGIPVARATVALRTLHPQIFGLGYVWNAGERLECNQHPHGELELPRFRDSPLRVLFGGGGPLHERLDGDRPLPFPVLEELRARGLTDYLGFSLRFSTGQCQALTLATDAAAGFSAADVAALGELAEVAAPALELYETHRVAHTLLTTYVGARAGQKIIDGRIRRGSLELIDAVLLSCDLRGFTALSADVGPEPTVAALNAYFDCVCDPIVRAGGEVLKFIGDGLLAAFPVQQPADIPRICHNALGAARRALVDLCGVDVEILPRRHLPLRAGVALHVGEVAFGNIGSRERLDFTVIGPAVNLASRLAGLCAHLHRELLVSSRFAAFVPEGAASLGTIMVHGLTQPEEIFTY
jgi:adenylate cyclase